MYFGMISTTDYFPQFNIAAHDSGVTSVMEQQAPLNRTITSLILTEAQELEEGKSQQPGCKSGFLEIPDESTEC